MEPAVCLPVSWQFLHCSFFCSFSFFSQLDMAPHSVDDLYLGCEDKREKIVKTKFLLNETKENDNFSLAWSEAENTTTEKGNANEERLLGPWVKNRSWPFRCRQTHLKQTQGLPCFNEAVWTERCKQKSMFGHCTSVPRGHKLKAGSRSLTLQSCTLALLPPAGWVCSLDQTCFSTCTLKGKS